MAGAKNPTRRGYFSPRQTAIQLRTTVNNVRHLRNKGILGGDWDKSLRLWWYAKTEVAAARIYLESSKPLKRGEQTARAFDLFADGTSIPDVVRKLRITTSLALSLLHEFDPGYVVLGPEDVARLRAALHSRGMVARNRGELLDVLDKLCDRDARLAEIELSEAG